MKKRFFSAIATLLFLVCFCFVSLNQVVANAVTLDANSVDELPLGEFHLTVDNFIKVPEEALWQSNEGYQHHADVSFKKIPDNKQQDVANLETQTPLVWLSNIGYKIVINNSNEILAVTSRGDIKTAQSTP